jgi:hypothetical protein
VLNTYITQTQRLLQNPAPATGLYSTASVTDYVNVARKQLAGEAACIRVIGTIPTVDGQRSYSFGNINLGGATGVAGVFNVRRINYGVGDGQAFVTPRPWEWFDQYCLNNPVPFNNDPQSSGSRYPQTWSQYGQGGGAPSGGSSQSGSFYIDPIPDGVYTLYCDCACFPVTLADDSTPEAIPFIFTDAVPFLAAWYALLSTQTQARRADAEAYYGYYQTFLERARKIATPAVLAPQYEQASDPVSGGGR